MDEGQDKDVVSGDPVDESITPDEKLSKVCNTAFWHHPATLGEGLQ